MEQDERDLLVRVDQKMNDFMATAEKFITKAESEEGFARCQVHKSDMGHITKSLSRTRKGIWAAAGAIIIKVLADIFIPS